MTTSDTTHTGVYCPVTNKVSYPSRIGALMAKARVRTKLPNIKNVYQCPHPQCQQWHLTSQEARTTTESVVG